MSQSPLSRKIRLKIDELPPRPAQSSNEELAEIFGGHGDLKTHSGRADIVGGANKDYENAINDMKSKLGGESGESLGSMIGMNLNLVKENKERYVATSLGSGAEKKSKEIGKKIKGSARS